MPALVSKESVTLERGVSVSFRLPRFFLLGLRESAPVAVSFVISFFAIGALSRASELTLIQTVAMTGLVFAGPAQYAILSFFTSGASLPIILISVLVINFRFLIMAFNLLPVFRGVPRRYILPALPMLSASTFALTSMGTDSKPSGWDNFQYYLGVCLGSFPVAVLMAAVGYVLSANLSPELTKTVPVILPIYFAVLLAKDWKKWGSLAAAGTAFCLHPILVMTFSKNFATVATVFLAALIVSGFVNLADVEKK